MDCPFIAEESTPLMAIKIFLISNSGELLGFNFNNKLNNSNIVISDALISNWSFRKDFFAPPISFTEIIST